MEKDYFGTVDIKYYRNECSVLALDEYKKDQGQDEFSRKQVWFYVYGDEEIEKEFHKSLKSLLKSRFIDDEIDWDLMTLYPTHVQGEVNQHMQMLLKSLASELGIKYDQVVERTKTIRENHELDTEKAKTLNLEGSIGVEGVEGKNVILVDNISLSGMSLLHGAEKLIDGGAEHVFGVCVGMGEEFPNKELINRDKKASELIK
ncbi:MAG: hypothetical protein R6V35_00890 [Candidatus Nanohaloarchaea archaeon]